MEKLEQFQIQSWWQAGKGFGELQRLKKQYKPRSYKNSIWQFGGNFQLHFVVYRLNSVKYTRFFFWIQSLCPKTSIQFWLPFSLMIEGFFSGYMHLVVHTILHLHMLVGGLDVFLFLITFIRITFVNTSYQIGFTCRMTQWKSMCLHRNMMI